MNDPVKPAARRVRAFFAPVERATGAPAIFDPAHDGCFALDAPPAGWIDAGDVDNFVRMPATRIEAVRGGAGGGAAAQYRARLEARVEFDFARWGKLQMAIAGGSEHLNLLAAAGSAAAPSGGSAAAAVPLAETSTAANLQVGAAAATFSAGQVVAVDLDYAGETGFVGAPIAGAYVRAPEEVGADPDFLRRVTFNIARIASITADALLLESALPGGQPSATAKVQRIIGFVDREGGRFFQEWSALFIVPEETGGRICFYYPRLQPAAPSVEMDEEVGPLTASSLHAELRALPITDPLDQAQAVCWRSYYPAAGSQLQ